MGKPGTGNLRGRVASGFYLVDPDEVVLVTDPRHPLFDERVNKPLDPRLVASIARKGVRVAITLRPNGDKLEVAVGRQRVRAARLVNKKRRAEGLKPIRIKAEVIRDEDVNFISDIITDNEIRTSDEVLIKAAKASRAIKFGANLAEVAADFGVTVETIENWLKLLDLHPRLSAAVARGVIKYTIAMRLARLPRCRQLAAWKKLKKARLSNANAQRVVVDGKLERVCPPTRNQLRRIADKFHADKLFLQSSAASDMYAFVSFVLGRLSMSEVIDCLSGSAGAVATIIKQVMGAR